MDYALPSQKSFSSSGRVDPLSTRGIIAAAQQDKGKASLHVGFEEKGEVKEKRERFLTAKYGSHQMALIRKRLAVEMWVYEELQKLYGCKDDSQSHDVDLDLDELLDLDDDAERRTFLQELIVDAKMPPDAVTKFIDDLLQRTKVL